jgi:hypothetical protein
VLLFFFDRVQVLALKILDQRDLEDIAIGSLAQNDWGSTEPDLLRCAPATFAGN